MNRLATSILSACLLLVGCGETKIKDYDEAVPIPDVPIAGGAGNENLEQPADFIPADSGTPSAGQNQAGETPTRRSGGQPAEEATPVQSVEG